MSKDDKKEINFVHRDKFLAEMFLKAERSVKPHTTFQVNPLKKTHILPDTPTTMDPSIVMAKIKEPGFADTPVVKLAMDPLGKKKDLWDPEAEEARQKLLNNKRMREGLDQQMKERQRIKEEELRIKTEEQEMIKCLGELYEQELEETAQDKAEAKKRLYQEIKEDIADSRLFREKEAHKEMMESKRTAEIQLNLLETYWKRKTTKKVFPKSGRSKNL